MTTASAPDTITLAEENARIEALGEALTRLWRREEQRQDAPPLSRCLTINLIAVAPAEREPELREAIQRVLLRHPARVFRVLLERQPDTLTASAEAQVRKHGQSRVLVLEQLNLRVGKAHLAKVPGLVRPLLVNDIPVHIFWAGPLPEDLAPVRLLAKMADSAVVDSSQFADPAPDLERLGHLRPVPVRDLTWFRLSSWRRALAEALETFDWSPKVATRITIAHGPAAAAEAASLVLRDWLLAKLGAPAQLVELAAGDDGGGGSAASVAEPPALEPARIEVEHGAVHVQVTHLRTEPCLRVDVTLRDHCLLPFHRPASRGTPGDLLAAAVDA